MNDYTQQYLSRINKQQAITILKQTAALLELHHTDNFSARHYYNAALRLERIDFAMLDISPSSLMRLPGIGKSMANHLHTLLTTGQLPLYSQLLAETPPGVLDMLELHGLGPKKVHRLWKKLDIQHLEDLSRACQTNQVAGLPGFGYKTQSTIQKALTFALEQAGQWHYATLLPYATQLEQTLQEAFPSCHIALSGALRRKTEVANMIQFLIGTNTPASIMDWLDQYGQVKKDPKHSTPWIWQGQTVPSEIPLLISCCTPNLFYQQLMLQTGSSQHLALTINQGTTLEMLIASQPPPSSEEAFYQTIQWPFIIPELREGHIETKLAQSGGIPEPVHMANLQGVLHVHTTYSDGQDTLQVMASHCKALGYHYIGITDHSQSAAYAGGLKPADIQRQHAEIEQLNQALTPFKIFKGIEADILTDGSLDYEDTYLNQFDFVIASVHSALQMDKKKATERLIRAIANPYTTMLGHPTGRLLLKRPGYEIDHKAVIDACVEHHTAIEVNANPWRLDLDWRWIPTALQKGAKLSINPDAHTKEQINNMYYGVCIARKGGLTKTHTLNAWTAEALADFFKSRY